MGNTVIKVENLSKQYRLGLVGASTFKEDAFRWWAKMRGKEDPFLKLGEENDRTSVSDSKFVWSLKDINFEVQQGDVLGIIGRNGAGKSTLLKILSKITSPTTGTVNAKGRIASLLEVGTGFHPELTGRENIFLNGAILGMRKHEIKSKLDEIIAFAGVERYIDTPVKRYSSGMYVRLAFAVAAHLESEILIIDEVLAVGDAEFQQKCMGKMGDISRNDGRTILFVSHNMSSINSLCNKGLFLDNGKVDFLGDINQVINEYRLKFTKNRKHEFLNFNETNGVTFLKINTSSNKNFHLFGLELSIKLEATFTNAYKNVAIAFQIKDDRDISVLNPLVTQQNLNWVFGNKGSVELIFPKLRLYQGWYTLTVHLGDKSSGEHIQTIENIVSFYVSLDSINSEYNWKSGNAMYFEDQIWKTKKMIYEIKY